MEVIIRFKIDSFKQLRIWFIKAISYKRIWIVKKYVRYKLIFELLNSILEVGHIISFTFLIGYTKDMFSLNVSN